MGEPRVFCTETLEDKEMPFMWMKVMVYMVVIRELNQQEKEAFFHRPWTPEN